VTQTHTSRSLKVGLMLPQTDGMRGAGVRGWSEVSAMERLRRRHRLRLTVGGRSPALQTGRRRAAQGRLGVVAISLCSGGHYPTGGTGNPGARDGLAESCPAGEDGGHGGRDQRGPADPGTGFWLSPAGIRHALAFWKKLV